MGLLDSIKSSSTWLKISAVLLLIVFMFTWISFTTASWGEDDQASGKQGWGLWRTCSDNDFQANCSKLDGTNVDWYRALQAFAVMAFISVNLCVLLVALLIFIPSCTGSKSLAIWTAILAFWSAVCYIIAISIFAGKFDDSRSFITGDEELDYGWAMALICGILQIPVGIFMALEAKNLGSKFTDI